ncbi:hypothetical protein [Empedobacter sp. UBA5637]|uniref:hypothetical protein n=1 Tax=Empedobacter sp. UBA5637 TaxID=1946442 RepID=UPI0025C10A0D|nr:hypothetical protein [Empedobacter sp. UBA5637]
MKTNYLFYFLSFFIFSFYSCSSDDQEIDNTIKNESKFNYQKFYKDHQNAILSMDRINLSGLNHNLLILAYEDLSTEKKVSLWKDKFISVSENGGYSNQQNLFLKK